MNITRIDNDEALRLADNEQITPNHALVIPSCFTLDWAGWHQWPATDKDHGKEIWKYATNGACLSIRITDEGLDYQSSGDCLGSCYPEFAPTDSPETVRAWANTWAERNEGWA